MQTNVGDRERSEPDRRLLPNHATKFHSRHFEISRTLTVKISISFVKHREDAEINPKARILVYFGIKHVER